ncbi:MAG: glutathione S-transferase [Woeseiaceae bacterium]|nr:glutathione S-transferase [Woeseiaceae bacterium]
MITIHHLDYSRSQRPIWLLEELGVDYEVKRYQRDSETMLAPPELQEVHPLGKSPVLTDYDVTVAESGAIIEYLLDKYDDGRLQPADEPGRRALNYWLHYAEGSFMPLMIISLILNRIETAPMPFFVKPIAKGIAGKVRSGFLNANLDRHLGFIEASLSAGGWFCGDRFTAADIQMSYCLEAAEVRTDVANEYPNISDFLARIRAREAYQRAMSAGGPASIPSFA